MRLTWIPLLLLGACSALTGTNDGLADRERVLRVRTGDGSVIETGISAGDAAIRSTSPAAPGDLYTLFPSVFETLGLEVNSAQPGDRMMGVENVRLRRIAGRRPSNFLECGPTPTGPAADAYDIYLTLLAQAMPGTGGGSEVRVHVLAGARNPAHGNNVIRCRSTGRLEALFLEELNRGAQG